MKSFFILLFCCCFTLSYGQKGLRTTNIQAQRKYDAASQALSYDAYERAIAELQGAIKLDPEFAAAYQRIGDVNRILKRYQAAAQAYKKVLEINPEFDQRTYYGLGQSEFYSGNYSEALRHLKKYQAWPNQTEANKLLVSKDIIDCEFSIEAIKKPVVFNPKNLGPEVNSSQGEYLPVVTADEETLIFTRRTNDNEDFFSSKRHNNRWTKATYLSPNINTPTFNEGAQCISPDGMYLFFTGCNRPDGAGKCDIYVCKREGKDWSKPFNLGPQINSRNWESQPSVSANGRTLYFVSDRAGGFGGEDIWKTELQGSGSWSTPVNLGPNINTRYNEYAPFIHHDDNTLYFASDGWPGFGNEDLFFSKKDDAGNFAKSVNIGYPINSPGEEKGLTVSSDGRKAYFSSSMAGGYGGMDIYSFELPQSLRPDLVTYVKGKVIDSDTRETLSANVKITSLKNDIVAFEELTDAETGEFLAIMQAGKTFGLSVEREGYLFHSENFSLTKPNAANKPFQLLIPLKKIKVGGMVVLKNIFFETNKFGLMPESKAELLELINFLELNPTVAIEIGGHTDDVGDDKFNLTLSENRAKTVYDFLVNNKIEAARLTFKGYGETKPVAANTTEDGRQQNRRTEFKIVKQ
ncbi:MAG: PD40 domain-containing protein [Sphingobacteriaceae bacterium]|nr:PD40 domain-containing protein [Sphingobacteriaceae bacterium]